jgi:Bacterial Ig domain
MTVCGSPLSRSLLGVKRTPRVALHMSAFFTSVAISAAPTNGSASVNGDAVLYQSQSGFIGQDSFTFTLSGSGPGGSGTSAVQVSVSVK